MKEVVTIVTATTELMPVKNFEDSKLVLFYDGKSSNVSSGSQWGGSCDVDIPDEDPVDVLKRIIKKHNEWLDTIKDAGTGELTRLGLMFKNKATLNGKDIIIDADNNSLSKWIQN